MEQVSSSVFAETQIRGCNHGFVVTSEGVVMIDSPQKPSDALKLKDEIARHGELLYIINTEPHGDHWTGNAYFDVPVIAHEGVRQRILDTNLEEHVARVAGMGPEEPALLENYTPNAPVITFRNGMTLHVGDHSFQMIHMPGHTLYQAAILIKEEGVVFTSDNIFHKVQTYIQEANPDQWLRALESLRRLDEEIFIPGHGRRCDKSYLDEQGEYILEWKEYARQAVERGMTREEAAENLTDLTDRYPMDVGQDGTSPRVMKMNAANLWDYWSREGIHTDRPD
ncbi:MAG: MBL fold metallo-hydrolase [Chloroflexota bacterium]|nr:MBL fold metallo-hydrolase [Chloroflexota bacterium]